MTNATLGSQIDDNVGALETALCDILGMPINTDIAAALFEIVAAGLKSIYLQDAAADPSVNGQIRRNGSALRYYDGTRVIDVGQAYDGRITTGMMLPYAPGLIVAPSAPAGFLFCDGAAISRATYAALFALIGINYGAGDGSTTFNLPNLLGRVLVGYDAGQSEFATIGANGGEKTHTLTEAEMPSHTHSYSDAGHSHTYIAPNSIGGPGFNTGSGVQPSAYTTSPTGIGISINPTGGGVAQNNLQPYLTMRWIIKT